MFNSKVFKLTIICATVFFILAVAYSIKYFFFNSPETAKVEVAVNTNTTQIPANKPNLIKNDKIEKDLRLQTQADLLLNLFDNMPQVPVFIKDEPILKTGTNTERGLGYTTCENKNVPTVYIKKAFYQKNNQIQIINILKHELTHAYFCRQGMQVDHDSRWRKKFESIGGFGN
jgi:hypothetical protein